MNTGAMKQAFDALLWVGHLTGSATAIAVCAEATDALRQAIEQAEKQEPVANHSNCGHKKYKPFCQMCMATKQKPVAWICEGFGKEKHNLDYVQEDIDALEIGTALYTAPPMTPEHLPQYFTTNGIKPMQGGGGGGSQPEQEPEEFVRWGKEKEFFDAARTPLQTEQVEPMAWMTNSEQDVTAEFLFSHVQTPMHNIPLYEAPPRKEWVGLTTDEIFKEAWKGRNHSDFARGAEWALAKLKEKNT